MAGFFALLYATLGLGSAFHEDVKTTMYKNESKEKAIKNNDLTYTDGRGNEYYIDTDSRCETVIDTRTGHRVIRELNNKGVSTRILYDYDALAEYREKIQFEDAVNKAKHYGKKYFYWKFNHQDVHGICKYTGYEVETGKRYIVSRSGNTYFMKYYSDEVSTRYKPNGTYEEYYKLENPTGDIRIISLEEYQERSDKLYWNQRNS